MCGVSIDKHDTVKEKSALVYFWFTFCLYTVAKRYLSNISNIAQHVNFLYELSHGDTNVGHLAASHMTAEHMTAAK